MQCCQLEARQRTVVTAHCTDLVDWWIRRSSLIAVCLQVRTPWEHLLPSLFPPVLSQVFPTGLECSGQVGD